MNRVTTKHEPRIFTKLRYNCLFNVQQCIKISVWELINFSSRVYHSSKYSQTLEDKAVCSYKRSVTNPPATQRHS